MYWFALIYGFQFSHWWLNEHKSSTDQANLMTRQGQPQLEQQISVSWVHPQRTHLKDNTAVKPTLFWLKINFTFWLKVFGAVIIINFILIIIINILFILTINDLYIYIYIFGYTVQLVGSQFPNQGLNLGHGSERPES